MESEPDNTKLNELFGRLARTYETASPAEKKAFEQRLIKLNEAVFFCSLKDLDKQAFTQAASETNITWKMWVDRPNKRRTNPAKWILEHHGDLVGVEGARSAIGRRDPKLIQSYASWIRPTRHPEDDLGLDTQRANLNHLSAEEILARKRKQLQEASLRYREKRMLSP